MDKPRFQFGNVVVVDEDQIGLIVKTWGGYGQKYKYEVYVRSWNCIKTFPENQIAHFVFSKELSEDEREFY